jgi:hypothetical protein
MMYVIGSLYIIVGILGIIYALFGDDAMRYIIGSIYIIVGILGAIYALFGED